MLAAQVIINLALAIVALGIIVVAGTLAYAVFPQIRQFLSRLLDGGPACRLLAAARDADMIVVGSRGAGGFARLPVRVGQYPGQPPRALPGRHRPRGRPRIAPGLTIGGVRGRRVVSSP